MRRSGCASKLVRDMRGLRSLQTESLDFIGFFNVRKCPDETAHVQDDMNAHFMHV